MLHTNPLENTRKPAFCSVCNGIRGVLHRSPGRAGWAVSGSVSSLSKPSSLSPRPVRRKHDRTFVPERQDDGPPASAPSPAGGGPRRRDGHAVVRFRQSRAMPQGLAVLGEGPAGIGHAMEMPQQGQGVRIAPGLRRRVARGRAGRVPHERQPLGQRGIVPGANKTQCSDGRPLHGSIRRTRPSAGTLRRCREAATTPRDRGPDLHHSHPGRHRERSDAARSRRWRVRNAVDLAYHATGLLRYAYN